MPHRHSLPPRPDPFGPSVPRPDLALLALIAMLRRRRKGTDRDRGGMPVQPNGPNTLSGGAAAPLEFEGE
jgi:hypothetical protein